MADQRETVPDRAIGSGDGVRRALSIRIAALYGAMFAVFGLVMPYFNPWLAARGLSVAEIAVIAAVPHLVRPFSTPLIAYVADRNSAHRGALVTLAAIGALGWIATALSSAFALLLALQVVIGITAAMMPLVETVAMSGVKRHGIDYGRVRVWGSITFVAATLLGGVAVSHFGLDVVMVLIIPSAIAAVAAAYMLPRSDDGATAATDRPKLSLQAAIGLARDGRLLLLMLTIAAVQSSHGMMYTYGSVHWQSLGMSSTWIGALWATGVVAEILLFTVAARITALAGPATLLLIGAAAAAVRWLVMAWDPPLWALFVLQAGHALSFGASHIGAMHALVRLAPDGQAGTAQALASVATALAFATANACAGLVYGAHGPLAYLPMAAFAVVAAASAMALGRRLT